MLISAGSDSETKVKVKSDYEKAVQSINLQKNMKKKAN